MDTIIDPEMLCSFSFCNHLSLSELEKVNHIVEDHGDFFKKNNFPNEIEIKLN